jgi:hypothetical protein
VEAEIPSASGLEENVYVLLRRSRNRQGIDNSRCLNCLVLFDYYALSFKMLKKRCKHKASLYMQVVLVLYAG